LTWREEALDSNQGRGCTECCSERQAGNITNNSLYSIGKKDIIISGASFSCAQADKKSNRGKPTITFHEYLEINMAEQNKIARRSFFAGLGMVAAAGVAAKLSPALVAPAATIAPEEPQGDSYRLSEHIKKYYRTTQI
jgi:hypothetical protein